MVKCELLKSHVPLPHVFPPSAYGRALRAGQLDAIDFVAIAIPSLRSLRLSHIKRRRLIMPLVALVQKKTERTRNFVLLSGARRSLPRRRCSSRSVFEQVSACLRTLFRALHRFIAFLLTCQRQISSQAISSRRDFIHHRWI